MNTYKTTFKLSFEDLKKHYLLFVFVCMLIAVVGADFSGTLDGLNGQYSDFGVETNDTITSSVLSNKDVFGETKGVFAGIAKGIDENAIISRIMGFIENVISSDSVLYVILAAIVAMVVVFFVEYTVFRPIKISVIRVMLENREYDMLPVSRFLLFIKTKKWFKVVLGQFCASFLHALWTLTIVGYPIKRYSYYLVPYILAENPDISAMDAINLSRKMMNGHKWECFLYELTFLAPAFLKYIHIIPFLGFMVETPYLNIYAAIIGMLFLFFINPMKYMFFVEYYAQLRQMAFAKVLDINVAAENKPHVELLKDTYLYQHAPASVIDRAYGDMDDAIRILQKPPIEQKGFLGFLAKNFSIIVVRNEASKDYEKRAAAKLKLMYHEAEVEGKAYPTRLSPLSNKKNRSWVERMHYDRQYPISHIIMMFFTGSIIGWVWEVLLHLVQEMELVNRGTMWGPWLPIYGSGACLVLMLLTRLRKRPGLTFTATIILCGILEYATSYYLEIAKGTRWWDYTGYFLNINGRICGEGLLIFGIGGLSFVYLFAPMLDNLLYKFHQNRLKLFSIIFSVIFLIDLGYSAKYPNAGEGITESRVENMQNIDNGK